MYCIAIKFMDKEINKILELGGAGWETREEWKAQWDNIPTAKNIIPPYLGELLDDNEDIVDDRHIDRETVETLLGEPITALIERARALEE